MTENSNDIGISFRCNKKISNMISELKDKMCLNTTSIIIIALVMLYEEEIGKISKNNGSD